MMKFKPLIMIALAAAMPLIGTAARAQSVSSPVAGPELATPEPPRRIARHRIEIYPGRLLYRRCVDWYELQNRPSGTVLYPQMRCWWVRG
jgi:hypothetical protein